MAHQSNIEEYEAPPPSTQCVRALWPFTLSRSETGIASRVRVSDVNPQILMLLSFARYVEPPYEDLSVGNEATHAAIKYNMALLKFGDTAGNTFTPSHTQLYRHICMNALPFMDRLGSIDNFDNNLQTTCPWWLDSVGMLVMVLPLRASSEHCDCETCLSDFLLQRLRLRIPGYDSPIETTLRQSLSIFSF